MHERRTRLLPPIEKNSAPVNSIRHPPPFEINKYSGETVWLAKHLSHTITPSDDPLQKKAQTVDSIPLIESMFHVAPNHPNHISCFLSVFFSSVCCMYCSVCSWTIHLWADHVATEAFKHVIRVPMANLEPSILFCVSLFCILFYVCRTVAVDVTVCSPHWCCWSITKRSSNTGAMWTMTIFGHHAVDEIASTITLTAIRSPAMPKVKIWNGYCKAMGKVRHGSRQQQQIADQCRWRHCIRERVGFYMLDARSDNISHLPVFSWFNFFFFLE